MLEGWRAGDPLIWSTAETADEPPDCRTSPEQTCLHLLTPVDTWSSTPPSGEHGAPVCTAREGAGTGLERIPDPHPRPGPGEDGYRDGGEGGLQDLGGGYLDGSSGCGICIGSLAIGALKPGLASAAGAGCAHHHTGDRRRWLLRSGGLQRRIVARIERDHGRTSLFARAPPGRQAQQSEERRVALSTAGRLLLRRGKPDHPGPRRRSARRGGLGVSSLSRNGNRLRRDAMIRRRRVTLSPAVLWGRLGWQDNMGSPDAQPCAGLAQEPILCRDMQGCTSLAVIAARSAQRAGFINGYRRSPRLTGASA